MNKIILLCTTIMISACSSYEPRTYRITTTTKSCPKDYMYNSYNGMCYYTKQLFDLKALAPDLGINHHDLVKVSPKPKKRLKTAKEESINCVKALHYCGVNDGKL